MYWANLCCDCGAPSCVGLGWSQCHRVRYLFNYIPVGGVSQAFCLGICLGICTGLLLFGGVLRNLPQGAVRNEWLFHS
ncbi:MAG: hypothetical protein B7Y58_11095 [Halothiobacillus sp. 35-54-62]|nr:MAG: hypothetical protein B7Y58_11095 [Halothiobacillus sp. 35-54-62]